MEINLSKYEIEQIIKCIEFTDSEYGSNNSDIVEKLKEVLAITDFLVIVPDDPKDEKIAKQMTQLLKYAKSL